jgi:VanZ family protein
MKKVYLITIIIYLGFIFYFSSIPVPRQLQNKPDIILHLIEYGGLGFLFAGYYTDNFKNKMEKSRLLFIIVFILLYAISDEFHQSFIKGRVSSIKDVIVDLVGGAVFPVLFYKKKERCNE